MLQTSSYTEILIYFSKTDSHSNIFVSFLCIKSKVVGTLYKGTQEYDGFSHPNCELKSVHEIVRIK